MLIFAVKVLLWLVCGVLAYLLVRRGLRGISGTWTQLDRLNSGFFCLVYGPFTLLIVIVAGLAIKLADTNWAKREARW
jgi:hypothetical protein